MKRRQGKDVLPYSRLLKQEGYIQILREYVPAPLAQKLVEAIPKSVLREILKRGRGVAQEYLSTFFDRIIKNEIYTLPKVAVFEELKHAMIASQAEKLTALTSFIFMHRIEDVNYIINLEVKLSR